jgi:hypothetical protein
VISLCAMWLGAMPSAARACAVCFGDPESGMAQGVVAGVFVLIGVVGFVLVGLAGTGLFWMHRARQLSRSGQGDADVIS